jgi:pyruvate kinase
MTRRTKIVATLGPASESIDVLRQLVTAGVDVMRLNLSHGPVEEHLARLSRVRQVAGEMGRAVAVLADLPGPKIRAGTLPDGGLLLAAGDRIVLAPGDGPSDGGTITVDYDRLLDDLAPGDRVIIGDGAITLEVEEVDVRCVVASVRSGGSIQGRPGVHLACEGLQLSAPTAHDLELAEAAAAAEIDYVAVSFVRRRADMDAVRAVVGGRARLVAKIETRAALADLPAIVDAADAVMVARGDLGIDFPLEEVPSLQKRIIRHCVEWGVPVITATQMLESMIDAPAPTRAEVSDVANAVFDGTDALMLSGETAIGHDPVNVVATMARIAENAEREANYARWAERLARVERRRAQPLPARTAAAISHAAWQAARDVDVAAILCCTRSGRTARAMARFRPGALMVGLSPDPRAVNAMQLTWGVVPVRVDLYQSTDEMIDVAIQRTLDAGLVRRGDLVIVLAGAPGGPPDWSTDVLRIVQAPGRTAENGQS